MNATQKSTNSVIHEFPSVPTSKTASQASINRAQLALNKIAFNFLAKYEKEPLDEKIFMQLACTWSFLDSELSKNNPDFLTSEKVQKIAHQIHIFGKEVEALAHPKNMNVEVPSSSKIMPLANSENRSVAEKTTTHVINSVKVPEVPKKPITRPLGRTLARPKPASASPVSPRVKFESVENGPIGLANIGNSCYLNSSLQLLFNISDVREWINREGPKAKRGELLSLLFELLNLTKVEENKALTRKLRTFLLDNGLRQEKTSDFGQKDAHEVLNIVLDKLNFRPMQIGNRYNSKNDPNLHHLSDLQPTYELEIELEDTKSSITLQDVINGYFKEEDMPIESHVTINEEETYGLQKTAEIVNSPSHLIISLKRFKAIGKGENTKLQKTMTPIELSVDKPVLLPHGKKKVQYEVIGYVNHHGATMKGGHYTANVKNCKDPDGEQRWIACNDSNVKVSAPKTQSNDPYIILLKKMD